MCGIFGIITNQDINIGSIALEAIRKLEYRGYDSCGMVSIENTDLQILKDSGKIDEIHEKLHFDTLNGSIALAHTRWATHGPPTKDNSHPHTDCTGEIAVVHNGIIENFIELKKELISKGHSFKSETDTEIVPHLIEEKLKEGYDFKEAVVEALKKCEGAYALSVCYAKEPNSIIVARKESPLIVGMEEGKTSYCASDIPALLQYTRNCFILEDNEMAILKAGEIEFFDIENSLKKITKQPKHINWDIDAAEKNGYEHFMLKEIFEEPDALRKTLKTSDEEIELFARKLIKADHIYITAAGTSFYASLAGKYIITRFLGKYIQEIECSEFQNKLTGALEKNTVIIAISQSGETVDTIEAIRWAKEVQKDITILAITNIIGSSITRYSDHSIITRAGPEIGVAATKTYVTQVLSLALIALKIAGLRKKLAPVELDKYYDALKSIPEIIEIFLKNNLESIKEIVQNLEKNANYFFLARGISIATAKEGGLKLKEVACRFIEGYSAAHAKHGPISLVREGFPIIFIAPPDKSYERLVGNVMEFKARGGHIISLVVDNDETISEMSDITIRIPQPSTKYYQYFSPITFIPALQLLAYYAALDHNLDPDKPLNLAKTVTVH
ncbi:MAG: Glutamine--fructose-6-phosphate aminotransferase [isomerizing] [Promethearchaeota archaeon]|nr:MAG: Glutamine--fructose-6-phosphate aminotransferase [isomerizing] [Candidatus Lokiarchaeota archaeon]